MGFFFRSVVLPGVNARGWRILWWCHGFRLTNLHLARVDWRAAVHVSGPRDVQAGPGHGEVMATL